MEPTSIRLDEATLARLQAIADAMSERASGAPVKRSAATRIALERGMVELEAELKIRKPKK